MAVPMLRRQMESQRRIAGAVGDGEASGCAGEGEAMKPNTYKILSRAVEEGVDYGWHRAHKHVEKPDDASVRDAIADAVISEICEWFDLDDEVAVAEASLNPSLCQHANELMREDCRCPVNCPCRTTMCW